MNPRGGLCLALCLTCLAGCSREPNVVILLVDTLRADRVGAYGYERPTTPVLDSLAATSTLYERCYAPADYTSASTASLFTGLYPLAHGYVHSGYRLAAQHTTLAERFRGAGYRTAAFVANGLAGAKYGMDQGFDRFHERNGEPLQRLVGAALEFIDTGDDPFFLYLHAMEVHDPHRIPAPEWDRFRPDGLYYDPADTLALERRIMHAWWQKQQLWPPPDTDALDLAFAEYGDLYDAAIRHVDGQLGVLLRSLAERGLTENTIVVVTSDHGEQLLEHGVFGHGNSGYEEGLHVPMVIHDPRQPSAARVPWPVSLVDIPAVLLTQAGLPGPEEAQGVSIEARAGGDLALYSEGTMMANRPFHTLIQTLRLGPWKLILDRLQDTKALYHLGDDPGEQVDRFQDRPDIVARLADSLRTRYHQSLARRQRLGATPRGSVTPEKQRELAALGYLSSGGTRNAEQEFLPMRTLLLTAHGPFGDERDLSRGGPTVDFTTGELVGAQVVDGFRGQVGRYGPKGAWFDRRSRILLARGDLEVNRIGFTVWADTSGGRPVPGRAWIRVNGTQLSEQPITPGIQRLSAALPASVRAHPYLLAELVTDSRFLLRDGSSPRLDVHASIRLLRVQLD